MAKQSAAMASESEHKPGAMLARPGLIGTGKHAQHAEPSSATRVPLFLA